MSSPVEHTDVGAYALGLLEDEDRIAFETHLATCERCRSELAETGGMRSLFAEVEAGAFAPAPRADHVRRLPGRPIAPTGPDLPESAAPSPVVDPAARRAAKTRRAGTALGIAAAAAALVLIGVGIGGRGDDGPSQARVQPTPTQAPPSPGPVGDRHPARGTVRGVGDVTGAVTVEKKGWGSRVALELGGVRGPLRCSLVAVGKDETREVVGSWAVPGKGYGVPGSPAPLLFEGGTSIAGDALDHFEVRTGDGRTLLTVPV